MSANIKLDKNRTVALAKEKRHKGEANGTLRAIDQGSPLRAHPFPLLSPVELVQSDYDQWRIEKEFAVIKTVASDQADKM